MKVHAVCCGQQLEELQEKYDVQVQQCSDLSNKLDATEVHIHMLCVVLIWE